MRKRIQVLNKTRPCSNQEMIILCYILTLFFWSCRRPCEWHRFRPSVHAHPPGKRSQTIRAARWSMFLGNHCKTECLFLRCRVSRYPCILPSAATPSPHHRQWHICFLAPWRIGIISWDIKREGIRGAKGISSWIDRNTCRGRIKRRKRMGILIPYLKIIWKKQRSSIHIWMIAGQ